VKQELLYGRPLSLDECIPTIKNKMSYYNNKTDALQQINILAIRPFESIDDLIKDFWSFIILWEPIYVKKSRCMIA